MFWPSKTSSDRPRNAFTKTIARIEVMTMRFASDEVYAASRVDVVSFTAGAMGCYL